MKRLRIGWLVAVLVLAGSAGSWAGGGGEKPAAGVPQGPVKISFSWWGNDARHKGTIAAIDLWNSKHPEVQVEYSYSGWDGYHDKLETQFAGRNAPDVFQYSYSSTLDYAAKGVLADLTAYTTTLFRDIDRSLWASTTVDGKVYGVPAGVTSVGLAYNKTMLDKLGVPVPRDGITWAELLELAKKATVDTNGDGKIDFWGITHRYDLDPQELEIVFRQYGGALWNDDLTASNFDTDTGRKVYAMLSSFVAAGTCVGPSDVTLPEGLNYVNGGYVAFGTLPLSGYPGVVAAAGGKYEFGVIRLPGVVAGRSEAVLGPAMDMAVYAGSKYPQAAMEFLAWLMTDVEAAKVQGMVRGLFVSSKVREAMAGIVTPETTATGAVISAIDAEGNTKPYPNPLAEDVWGDVYTTEKEKLVYGTVSVDQFLKTIKDTADPLLRE